MPVWGICVLLCVVAFAFGLLEACSAEAVEFYGNLLVGWGEGVVDICFLSHA